MTPTQRDYGRIRLFREDADALLRILFGEHDLLMLGRRERPDGEEVTGYNQRVAAVKRMLHELGRMRAEQGWDVDAVDAVVTL